MNKMTTNERIQRMYAHKEADRIPVTDIPWESTLAHWYRDGMPDTADFAEYFGLDLIVKFKVDTSPRYPVEVLEETDSYVIRTTEWGATIKNWKPTASTPGFLDFKVKGPDEWQAAKERMTPSSDRIPWDYLKTNYRHWREQGAWIEPELWFGFDVTHSWFTGTERLLVAMLEDPEWCMDMFSHFLEVNLALLDQVWEAGYTFDSVIWPDDMGYKHNQFFSLKMYRELLKPVHKRAIDWAHAKGIKAQLHSCGDINPFIPDLIDIGLDGLNPLEVKAGVDPLHLKRAYGEVLLLHGGINAVLWDDIEALETEIRHLIPILKVNGGYIFSSDHSVPESVALKDFVYIIDLVMALGSYE